MTEAVFSTATVKSQSFQITHAFTVGFLKDSVAVLLTADPHILYSQL